MIEILIFTFERPKYLRRSINYWSKSKFKIIIADGSEHPLKDKLPNNFNYFHLPKTSLMERTFFLADITKSKYAVFCADDDFHSFDAIKKIYNFLDKNEEYASAQGLFLRVGEKKNPKSLIFGMGYSGNISIDTKKSDLKDEQLLKYMIKFKFPICYSIMKNSVFKNYVKVFNGVNLKDNQKKKGITVQLFEDIMPYILFLSGHYKTLPIFYSMRQNQIQDYRAYYNNELYLNDFFADFVNKNCDDWTIIKRNLNNLIRKKYNFSFEFKEKDVLANYLETSKINEYFKENNYNSSIGVVKRILNHLKINLYILRKTKFNLISYISFYNCFKLIKKIVRNNDVEQ
ncbi:TIGR00180 family glycosyltransferase [Candidatus Pelagibacter sp.]|nr:TIGR00180 family glycosyltransferase [Candidatus Pelagibacter sp.]